MRVVDQSRNTYLDILRGLAISGVIAVHSNQLLNKFYPAKFNLLNYGKYGVEVFFFLSGFLIALLYGYLPKKLSIKYFRKRFSRIFPLWFLFLVINLFIQFTQYKLGLNSIFPPESNPILVIIQSIVLGTTFTLFLSAILWNTLIPGGWSIQSEVVHYLLFPLIKKFGLPFFAIFLTVCNFFSAEVGSSINYDNSDFRYASSSFFIGAWMRLGIYNTLSFFFLGVIAVYVFSGFNEKSFAKENGQNQFFQSSIFVIFCISLLISPCPFGNSMSATVYLIFNLIVMRIIAKIRLLSNIISTIGKYSYFMYFFHFVIIKCLKLLLSFIKPLPHPFFLFVIIFVITILLSLLFAIPSMKYIEKPIMRALG